MSRLKHYGQSSVGLFIHTKPFIVIVLIIMYLVHDLLGMYLYQCQMLQWKKYHYDIDKNHSWFNKIMEYTSNNIFVKINFKRLLINM